MYLFEPGVLRLLQIINTIRRITIKVDPHFGINEDLRVLVKEAHEKNIRVSFSMLCLIILEQIFLHLLIF